MKKMDWVIFGVVAALLLGLANQAENLLPSSFDAGKFVPSVVERRDNIYGVCTVGDRVIWMAGTNGKIVRSEDGGKTWSEQESGVREHFQDIAAWDELRAVAVGNGGVIVITEEGGKTWKAVESPRSEVANKLMQVTTGSAGRAWAVGIMGAIVGTKDYGATWARLVPEEDIGWNGIDFCDDLRGWVVGEYGRMKRTVDGGDTWDDVETVEEGSLMSVAFRDGQHGVAVGLEGKILVTEDCGARWAALDTSPTQEHLWDVFWHEDSQSWICVGNLGTYVVGDKEGKNWRASRLSDKELLWHTSIAAVGPRVIIVGGSQGVLEGENWSYIF